MPRWSSRAPAEDALADVRDSKSARIERTAVLRNAGQSFELDVSVGGSEETFDPETVAERFHAAHERPTATEWARP